MDSAAALGRFLAAYGGLSRSRRAAGCDRNQVPRAAARGGRRPPRLVVFFCLSDCWMSWNAAKRAAAYGLRGRLVSGWRGRMGGRRAAAADCRARVARLKPCRASIPALNRLALAAPAQTAPADPRSRPGSRTSSGSCAGPPRIAGSSAPAERSLLPVVRRVQPRAASFSSAVTLAVASARAR